MIKIIDDFLPLNQCEQILKYCYSAPYHYGEKDNFDTPSTGIVNNIDVTSEIYKLFKENTQNLVPDLHLYRMYVNCFLPGEQPYFHMDSSNIDDITFIYYVSTAEWNLDDSGETQFIVDKEILGIMPIPNRVVYFNANILHRATSFRNRWRWTIAIKYTNRKVIEWKTHSHIKYS